MDLKYKLYLFFLAFVSIFAFNTKVILAVEPELSLYPASGTVDLGRDFMVDVLVDTKGQEVVLVRAVLKFDPELVQVKTAERNEDIFCDWPEGEQLIDNVYLSTYIYLTICKLINIISVMIFNACILKQNTIHVYFFINIAYNSTHYLCV